MFFSLFERKIAWRYLRPNRQEGFISVIAGFSFLGITIGVATLIIVMSVMNGFREELFSKILGFNGHLRIEGISGHLRDFDELADKVRPFYGVESVTPLVEGQAMAMSKGTATGIIVRGVRKDDLKDRPIISDNIVDGSLADLEGTDAIVIGQALALRMGVRVGDPLTLVAPELNATAFGSIPRSKKYTVVGLFQSGNYEYDKGIVFLPLEAAQVFYRTGEGVTGLEIFLLSPNLVDITAPKMAKALNWRVNIRDWRQSNAAFFQAVNVERNVMFLILTLIILIAAFNIVSSLIMLVKDKTRDIAIIRTMGATKSSLMRIFFLTGASIGFAGTVAGFGLGLAFSLNIEAIRQFLQKFTGTDLFQAEIYFLSHLPAIVDPREVISVVLMAFVITFFATLYPSWRAARLDPVEALRNE